MWGNMKVMSRSSERGVAHILLMIVLLAGLAFGVYLVTQRTNLFSRASYISSPINPTVFGHSILLGDNGQTNSYVKVPPKSEQNPSGDFTIEAWIRPDLPDTPTGEQVTAVSDFQLMNIISKSAGTVSSPSYELNYISHKINDSEVYYYYQFTAWVSGVGPVTLNTFNFSYDSQGNPINLSRVSNDDAKTWRHVAGVIKNGNLYIYENGIQVAARSGASYSNFQAGNSPLLIGATTFNDGSARYQFYGEIDEVRISNVSRYDQDLNISPIPFTSDSNTIALLHFNDNFWDSSDYRNNAEARGRVILVNSAVGIQPTPIPTATPVPEGAPAPQPGPVVDLPAPLPDIPVPPIFNPVPTEAPVPTQAPVPTPTLAPGNNSWGTDTQVICQDGSTPAKKEMTRLVYAVWPDEPYDLNDPVKFKRTEFSYDDPLVQAISITNNLNVSSAYVGVETQSGQFLQPSGTPPDDDIEYGNFFGVNMVRWYKNELPKGYYNIPFQAPDSWCR